jgi:hypothetical protein
MIVVSSGRLSITFTDVWATDLEQEMVGRPHYSTLQGVGLSGCRRLNGHIACRSEAVEPRCTGGLDLQHLQDGVRVLHRSRSTPCHQLLNSRPLMIIINTQKIFLLQLGPDARWLCISAATARWLTGAAQAQHDGVVPVAQHNRNGATLTTIL